MLTNFKAKTELCTAPKYDTDFVQLTKQEKSIRQASHTPYNNALNINLSTTRTAMLLTPLALAACGGGEGEGETTQTQTFSVLDLWLTDDVNGVSNYGIYWAGYASRWYENEDALSAYEADTSSLDANVLTINQNITYIIETGEFRQNYTEKQYENGAWAYQSFTKRDLTKIAEYSEEHNLSLVYFISLMGDDGTIGQDGYVLGQFDVLDAERFFDKYSEIMVEQATIAQQIGADVVVIGQELALRFDAPNRLSWLNDQRWTDLIASMREVYEGKITYGAHFGISQPNANFNSNEALELSFGDQLDAIGINLYSVAPIDEFGQLTYHTPSIEEMIRLWARLPNSEVSPIDEFRKIYELWEKPIVITETGRLSGRYLEQTGDYDPDFIDLEGQANQYYADLFVLNVYLGDIDISYLSLPYMHPFISLETDIYSTSVMGKPAEDIIRYFFSGDFRGDNHEILVLAEFEFATGFEGDDTFIVESFSHTRLEGGGGLDTLVLVGNSNDYVIETQDTNGRIEDDTGNFLVFESVEILSFSNTQLFL